MKAAIDDDPRLYRAVADLVDGLVVEAFGAGQVRPETGEVLLEVAATKPVVLATRTGAGAVATDTYGGAGSGTDLVSGGAVSAGGLSAVKARVLLVVLLSQAEPLAPPALAAVLARHGA